jgi:Ca2+-binding RTX toxin-like protein
MGRLLGFGSAAGVLCLLLAAAAVAVNQGGSKGADTLRGTKAADTLKGRAGADRLIGGPGADVLIGGNGPDRIKGGSGFDSINMRRGVELRSPGRDRINARDRRPDAINCGAGIDVAIVDQVEDGVYFCEKVREPAS